MIAPLTLSLDPRAKLERRTQYSWTSAFYDLHAPGKHQHDTQTAEQRSLG